MPEMFKWVVVDIDDGSVVGTNDDKVAAEFAQAENYIVIQREECAIYAGYDVEKDANGDYEPRIESIREQRMYNFGG